MPVLPYPRAHDPTTTWGSKPKVGGPDKRCHVTSAPSPLLLVASHGASGSFTQSRVVL
jgi:hypothetical protein